MANIASGWLEISPLSSVQIEEIKTELESHDDWYVFNYGCDAVFEIQDVKLVLTFCGRWSCERAWDVLDSLMLRKPASAATTALVQARILGNGSDPEGGYEEEVKKKPGENELTRI
jgi:hypothetical protein